MIMEGVLTKLADVTYDFVGVLLPGLALLLILSLEWHVYLVASDGVLTWEAFARSVVADLNAIEDHPWPAFAGVSGASYLLGRALLFLAKKGLPVWALLVGVVASMCGAGLRRLRAEPRGTDTAAVATQPEASRSRSGRRWLAFMRFVHRLLLLPAPKHSLRDHEPYLAPLLEVAAARLGLEGNLDRGNTWRTFQLVATRSMQQGEAKTRYQIHQYKYTLDRSLATAFAIGAWSSVLLLAGTKEWTVGLSGFVLCAFLSFVFDDEHAFHWGLWADVVIADAYAYLREVAK
jgi:hypothetical protein